MSDPAADVERAFRAGHGRAVAVLVRLLGDIGLAEEAVQEAYAEAVRRWPVEGTPDTDWAQILQLYDHLVALAPSPVAALHRSVALAEVCGPAEALATVDTLGRETPALHRHHVYHAVRADLLRRLFRPDEARAAYQSAITHTSNTPERAHLTSRLHTLPTPTSPDELMGAGEAG
ncbi:hypothetical protein [Micromonospora sp. RTGN7]|uniref:hypothetical protein n=1 Tax=Micromonospora sp. RTGN7 TaxID=3016526 RepID=UPI0029FF2088|nr:hypothetical protein [Micromonospora sp. RTGN7]